MAFGKALSEALKSAARKPAVRKAAQETLATLVAAGAEMIARQVQNVGKTSPPSSTGAKNAIAAKPDDKIRAALLLAGKTFTPDDSKEYVEEDPGMNTLGEVEESIRRVERVAVSFVHRKSGRNVRDDRRGFMPYSFVKKAPDDLRVSDFIRRRLADYERHGLKAIVKYENDDHAHGGTRLSEVRETYDGA